MLSSSAPLIVNDFTCRICKNRSKNPIYIAREMMFGFRDEFCYFECSGCGCLQITKIPDNINKYYPKHYFEETGANKVNTNLVNLKRFLIRQRTCHLLGFLASLVISLLRFGRPNKHLFLEAGIGIVI